jgi:hypothetical protein
VSASAVAGRLRKARVAIVSSSRFIGVDALRLKTGY